jgi:hypothetical protein
MRVVLWRLACRARAAYLQGGVELAVLDVQRSGSQRWTMDELEHAARHELGMQSLSRETVRHILKKTISLAPGVE